MLNGCVSTVLLQRMHGKRSSSIDILDNYRLMKPLLNSNNFTTQSKFGNAEDDSEMFNSKALFQLSWERFMGKSDQAFVNLMQFISLFQSNLFASFKTQQTALVSNQEHEIQCLRDAVSQLLSTGYWELAEKTVEYYLKVQDALNALDIDEKRLILQSNTPTLHLEASLFTFDEKLQSTRTMTTHSASPLKVLLSTSMKSFYSANSPLQSPHQRKRFVPPPSLQLPPTPSSQFQQQSSIGPFSPANSMTAPPHISAAHSPMPFQSPKRNETIKKELSRMSNKLKEKLKLDGTIRFPPTYYGIRFLSTNPNFYSLLSKRTLDPFVILKADSFNFMNAQALNFASRQSNTNDPSVHQHPHSQWYECWFVLKLDMAAYASCMQYYRDYIDTEHSRLQGKDQRRVLSSYLNHPLSYHAILQLLQRSFPEYSLVPNQYSIHDISWSYLHDHLSSLQSNPSSSSPLDNQPGSLSNHALNFVQLYPLFETSILDQSQDESQFISVCPVISLSSPKFMKTRGFEDGFPKEDENVAETTQEETDESGASHTSDDEDDDDTVIEMDQVTDLFQSEQEIRKQILHNLDNKFLDFSSMPHQFYVYQIRQNYPYLTDFKANSETANDIDLLKMMISTDDHTAEICYHRCKEHFASLPATTVPSSSSSSSSSSKLSSLGQVCSDPILLEVVSNITPLALSSWNYAWQTDEMTYQSIEAAKEIMFYHAVRLNRMDKCIKHLLTLKSTELVNQPDFSVVHSDNLFLYSFACLCDLLQQPGISPISLINVDAIVSCYQSLLSLIQLLSLLFLIDCR
jgi:hypothetical protein